MANMSLKKNEMPVQEPSVRKNNFGDAERLEKERTAKEIIEHAICIVDSDNTFLKKLH